MKKASRPYLLNKIMKILFLSTHLNTGGITAYLYTLTKGLICRGIDVHIATSGGDMESEFFMLGAKLVNFDIRTKSELSPKIYLNLAKMRRYIKSNKIDIIHSHTRVTQVMGQLLKSITGIPYVSTCHGYFKRRMSRRLAPCWGDNVIAISNAVVDHLVNDFNVREEKIVLVPSGIDIDKFSVVDVEIKKQRRKNLGLNDEPVLGLVARLSDVKGQDILVAAMERVVKRIPNAKLILFGQGKLEGMLKGMVARLGLGNSVIFDSTINKPGECMSVLDVFVAPSRMEGLGLSVMEAQSCGLPVVASRIGGIPSLIEDNKTGILVAPQDIESLANAIIRLFEDKQFAEKLGIAARAHALKNYSSEKMIEKTIAVYEKNISS